MILNKITLHPFGAVRNRSFTFEKGLNVLCGPNDIGKSTLFRAIESVLFLDVKPKANTLEGAFLRTVIPIGGDNARVTAEFEIEDRGYLLEKTWGAGHACRLQLPDGTTLNTQEKINEKLRQLLPASEATFKNILLTGQNRLEQTIAELKKNQDSLHSLGDILRKALSQTDGVSVDRLKRVLAEKVRLVFERWDDRSQGPEAGRGLERPWAHPGSLLKSWYEREALKKQRNDVHALETLLGDKANLLSARLSRQTQAKLFIHEHERTVEAINQRKTLSLQHEKHKDAVTRIQQDLNSWMKAETLKSLYEPDIQRLLGVTENLKREQATALAAAGKKSLVERFEKIEKEQIELQALRKAKEALPKITSAEIESLRKALQQNERHKAELSASRLAIRFTPRTSMNLELQKDLDPPKNETLASGQALEIQAGGRILLAGDHFELKITSGDGAIDQLEAQVRASESMIREFFEKMKITSLSDALAMHEAQNAASRQIESTERTIKSLLGQDQYDSLKQNYENEQLTPGTRDPSSIIQELSQASGELGKKKSELEQAIGDLARLKQTYASQDSSALLILLAEKSSEQKALQTELQALPSIPADIGDAETLLTRFKNAQTAFQTLSDELPGLSAEVGDLRARLPGQSAEELHRQYLEADQAFQKELRRGRALQRVQAVVTELESKTQDVYSELHGEFEKTIHLISSGKYVKSRMENSLPHDIVREDGMQIPFDWLSSGTKDAFALGLRLSMARYFLASGSGFLLVDDPMVAMDPERQKIAAQLMQNFASKSQTLVFTCHPSHAELLGGTRVAMEQ